MGGPNPHRLAPDAVGAEAVTARRRITVDLWRSAGSGTRRLLVTAGTMTKRSRAALEGDTSGWSVTRWRGFDDNVRW